MSTMSVSVSAWTRCARSDGSPAGARDVSARVRRGAGGGGEGGGGGVQKTLGAGAVPATPRTPGGLDRHPPSVSASAASARAPGRRAGEDSCAVTMLSAWAPLSIPFIRTEATGREARALRSEEHTSELQSPFLISY